MKLGVTVAVVIAILATGIWLLVGPMAVSVIGQHRERESHIESWAKTTPLSTRLGQIIGRQQENGRVKAFLGIRYAEPPIGEQRFKPAIASSGWEDTLEAIQYPDSCIQPEADAMTREPNSDAKSEDCLFLSVYTPGVDGSDRPVLFWIHGGAFVYGTGNGYPGTVLADQGDVVVVSINSRIFGSIQIWG